ncbi:MAG TPA: hypothetical protein VF708_16990 [Pyrinomonadaceae bacterium]|jgi:phosphoribosylformylglycinamidine (FGAM) synthase-like enzyme
MKQHSSTKRKAKHHVSDAYIAAVKAVAEAARKVEEAGSKAENNYQSYIQALSEKKQADEALRAALAELQQVEKK